MNIECLYKEKLMSAEEAVLLIPEVGSISIGMRVATPPALIEAVAKRARHGNIKDLRVYYMRSGGKALETLFQEDLLDVVHPYSSMLTKEEAKLAVAGFKKGKKLINFVPISFSRYPETISKLIDLDTFLVTVAPMDKHGYFNFGTNGDYAIELSRHAKKLIVEVNENMPRTAGESLLHISEVDAIIENTVPLLEEKPHPLTEVDHKIGQIIAPMICDGATIQIGIGRVPNAVAEHLVNHKDLGIHTEVITSGLIDLIKNGVVTNSKKRINRHVSVFTFAIGDRSVYDFIDDNLSMACMPVSYVNKPEIIGKNPNMVSINSFVEIDFFGQVNSEYIGHQFSGAGGQLDFIRGAHLSEGGISILASSSTAAGGKLSRIVPRLTSMTTDTRLDIDHIVTEYGHCKLAGLSTSERTKALISIAHPDFREELMRKAKEINCI